MTTTENRLIIRTRYLNQVAAALLKTPDLAGGVPHISQDGEMSILEMHYPGYVIALDLVLWLGMAQCCGLIKRYGLITGGDAA